VVGHLPTLQQIFRYLPTSAEGRKVNLIGNRLIAERQALVTEQKDFFGHFSSSGVFTQEELKLQVLTVITAGADTVTKALNQIFALLASRPDIQERIRQEMNDAFSGEGVPPSEILRNLEYLEGVIKEGLRMFSPLFRGAPATAPKGGITLETGDYIPQNTQIWISQYLVMTDERNFPRATEFLPERWISEESGKGNELVKDRRAWFPFGNGAHSCPGKALAMAEMRFIIAYMLREFDVYFEAKGGQPFNYEEWATDWKDFFAVEVGELYLKFVPRTATEIRE
jgi:cytochrome P450